MSSFFRKFRSFPEYSDYLNALSQLNETEKNMIQATKTAFNALPGYNKMQKNELHTTFENITDCGIRLGKIMKKNQKNLEPYKDQYKTLEFIQTESSKWTVMLNSVKSAADKSQAEAEKAKQRLEKLQNSRSTGDEIREAESAYDTAQRKAKMDLDSFNDTNKMVSEATKPFQNQFLGEYCNTTINYLDQRISCAVEVNRLCKDFEAASNSFVEYDDGRIDMYKKFIAELEDEERKLYGQVLPITEESSD